MMEIEQKTKEKDIENLYKQMMTIAENLIQNLETPMADEERLKILMNKNEQLIKITVQLAKKGHNIPLRIAEEAETYSKKYKIRKIILNVIMWPSKVTMRKNREKIYRESYSHPWANLWHNRKTSFSHRNTHIKHL